MNLKLLMLQCTLRIFIILVRPRHCFIALRWTKIGTDGHLCHCLSPPAPIGVCERSPKSQSTSVRPRNEHSTSISQRPKDVCEGPRRFSNVRRITCFSFNQTKLILTSAQYCNLYLVVISPDRIDHKDSPKNITCLIPVL